MKKSKIITKPHFTKEEKRNFKKGMPVGFGIGILVYLPHIAVILGFQSSWAISLVQVSLLIVYLTMLFIYAGFKFIVALTSISLIDKKQGYIDGIFASFISVQIFVFLWFPEIFIP